MCFGFKIVVSPFEECPSLFAWFFFPLLLYFDALPSLIRPDLSLIIAVSDTFLALVLFLVLRSTTRESTSAPSDGQRLNSMSLLLP